MADVVDRGEPFDGAQEPPFDGAQEPPFDGAQEPRAATVRSLGVVTAGSLLANLLAYLVQLPASRVLGPSAYGEFAVLLSAMLVLSVPALALQSVVAREVVRGRPAAVLWRLIALVTAVVAVASVGGGFAMMGIAHTGAAPAFAAMAGAAPLAVIAGGQGLVQGAGRFGVLGALLAAVGVLRSVPVIVAVLAGGGAAVALAAGTAGTVVAAVLVGILAGGPRGARRGAAGGERDTVVSVGGRPTDTTVSPRPGGGGAVLSAWGVQFVIIVAVSIDLLLSRSVLSAHEAGLYALGAVATKAAFWLPQAVGVVVYPRLADPVRSAGALRSAARVLAAIGAVLTAGAAVAGPLVPVIVSADYRPVAGLLWLFAYTGAALAVLQLLLLAAIAADRARGGVPASLVIVAEVVVIVTVAHSVFSLALIAAVSATAAVAVTGLWIALSRPDR
ncbi:polysaccharide biosynthesis protein [Gordonia sp. (in: high G+C Gram-positive bacteria)]|uniref:polysaccharide biosynthesis protein n=1 Tax=Gordonia sp. (in: high G+C Gram-positive bacteria) TaxID=84139 RepID=UPI002635CEA2|nr:polysaccharide biosynthesis protein [Gordonia sp. (in: high G+C Gram-positive bacteria)]